MQQTEQYGLNQWELTDQIKMADFNADNAKIAAALAGKLGRLELICTRHFPGGFSSIGFNFGIPDWSQWSLVFFIFDIGTTVFKEDDTMSFMLYQAQAKYPIPLPGSQFGVFLPLRDNSRQVQGFLIGKDVIPFQFEDKLFQDFIAITIDINSPTQNGIRNPTIFFYGMR